LEVLSQFHMEDLDQELEEEQYKYPFQSLMEEVEEQ